MVSTIARFILDPFNILLFLIAGVVIFKYLNNSRVYKWFFCSVALWFILITTPYLPYAVLSSLENRYSPLLVEELNDLEAEYHIVVLGAGYLYNERFPANTQLDMATMGRLVEGIRLHNQLPNSKIITSGPYYIGKYSQAEVVKSAAILLGVEENKILIQSEPKTTFEEANNYFKKHYSGQKVIVVTSAAHMYRALSEFQKPGIDVIPSPTNYQYKSTEGVGFTIIPSNAYISHLRIGIYEYAALLRNYFRDL